MKAFILTALALFSLSGPLSFARAMKSGFTISLRLLVIFFSIVGSTISLPVFATQENDKKPANANECMGLFLHNDMELSPVVVRILKSHKISEEQLKAALQKGPVIPADEIRPKSRQLVYFKIGNRETTFEAQVTIDETGAISHLLSLKPFESDTMDFDDLMEIHLIRRAPIEEIEQELREAGIYIDLEGEPTTLDNTPGQDTRTVFPITSGPISGQLAMVDELYLLLKEAELGVGTLDLKIMFSNAKRFKNLSPSDRVRLKLKDSADNRQGWFISSYSSRFYLIVFSESGGFIQITNIRTATRAEYNDYLAD